MAKARDDDENKAVAIIPTSSRELSSDIDFGAETEGLEGLGYSDKAEDTLVPILAILQDNSGEVKRNHAKQIEGALAGSVILRAFKKVIAVTKDEPLFVIPCGFVHCWVQWRGEPGEGQVISQYPFDDRPKDAVEKPHPDNKPGEDRTVVEMPNGDRLVDTRYHYCLGMIDGVWMPVVVPMGGTNHTVSRQWTGQMKAVTLPNGAKAPAWFRIYKLATAFNSRGAQSWYTYTIDDYGWNADKMLRDEGRRIFESVKQGELTPMDDDARPGANTDLSGEVPI